MLWHVYFKWSFVGVPPSHWICNVSDWLLPWEPADKLPATNNDRNTIPNNFLFIAFSLTDWNVKKLTIVRAFLSLADPFSSDNHLSKSRTRCIWYWKIKTSQGNIFTAPMASGGWLTDLILQCWSNWVSSLFQLIQRNSFQPVLEVSAA